MTEHDTTLLSQTVIPSSQSPASVQFYHLTATPLEIALPKLLEKIIAGGFRALVVAEDEQRVEQLNSLLWTYRPDSFLPHGSTKDGNAEQQPVFISNSLQSANGAHMLVITDGRNLTGIPLPYEKILDIFDGKNEPATAAARQRWTSYKKDGYNISYFQQSEHGNWQKKH